MLGALCCQVRDSVCCAAPPRHGLGRRFAKLEQPAHLASQICRAHPLSEREATTALHLCSNDEHIAIQKLHDHAFLAQVRLEALRRASEPGEGVSCCEEGAGRRAEGGAASVAEVKTAGDDCSVDKARKCGGLQDQMQTVETDKGGGVVAFSAQNVAGDKGGVEERDGRGLASQSVPLAPLGVDVHGTQARAQMAIIAREIPAASGNSDDNRVPECSFLQEQRDSIAVEIPVESADSDSGGVRKSSLPGHAGDSQQPVEGRVQHKGGLRRSCTRCKRVNCSCRRASSSFVPAPPFIKVCWSVCLCVCVFAIHELVCIHMYPCFLGCWA